MNDASYSHDCWPELALAISNLTSSLEITAATWPAEYAAIPGSTDRMHVVSDMAPDGGLGQVFEPWKTLPNPNNFTDYISTIKASVSETMSSDSEMTLSNATSLASSVEGEATAVPARMAEAELSIQGWKGETVDAFRKNYVNKFPYTLFLHVNIANLLAMALEVIQDTHGEARLSVAKIVEQTGQSMEALNCWGASADQERAKSVISAALTMFGVMTGPVGAIVGALNTTNNILNNTSTAISLHTDQRNTIESTIGGSTVDEVWASMLEALESLAADIDAIETDVMNVMRAVLEALDDPVTIQKNSYPLHELLRPPPPGAVTPETATESIVPPDGSYTRPDYNFEGR